MPRRRSLGKRKIDGKTFEIWDAFPTKKIAKQYAKDHRKQGNPTRVIDLGKGAGRLRYALFHREKRGRR